MAISAEERKSARDEVTRIVKERLRSWIDRKDKIRTTTRELIAGYERLHDRGYPDGQPSMTISSIMNRKEFAGKLWVARNCETLAPEYSLNGRHQPIWLYLKADAVPPKGYLLVPRELTKKEDIAAYMTTHKGGDGEVKQVVPPHHAEYAERIAAEMVEQQPELVTAPLAVPDLQLQAELADIIAAQADLLSRTFTVLARMTKAPVVEPARDEDDGIELGVAVG